MDSLWKGAGLALCLAALAGCGQEAEVADAPVEQPGTETAVAQTEPTAPAAPRSCEPEGQLRYICGLQNAEDLLDVGSTGMILASGMSRGNVTGHLYLIDPSDESVRELMFGGYFSAEQDAAAFPGCPGLINLGNFSIHGLSLREYEAGRFDLYVTSHGAREAIEIFDLDMSGEDPALTWRGCVVLPDNTFANSVAILADGGFVTTKMMDPSEGFTPINNGEISGLVYEWHPGGEVEAVPGTELSGANGIVLTDDERYMWVAAMGTREIVRFDRSTMPPTKAAVPVDVVPDNVRLGASPGRLLTAGGNYVAPERCQGADCATGWSVVEIDTVNMAAYRVGGFPENTAIQGVSTALQVGGDLWVGTFNGDRVAYFPR